MFLPTHYFLYWFKWKQQNLLLTFFLFFSIAMSSVPPPLAPTLLCCTLSFLSLVLRASIQLSQKQVWNFYSRVWDYTVLIDWIRLKQCNITLFRSPLDFQSNWLISFDFNLKLYNLSIVLRRKIISRTPSLYEMTMSSIISYTAF